MVGFGLAYACFEGRDALLPGAHESNSTFLISAMSSRFVCIIGAFEQWKQRFPVAIYHLAH